MSKEETNALASKVLRTVFEDYKNRGLLSIYFWGSIVSPDFDYKSSDIDAVGILSDDADFNELDQIREWIPQLQPKLKRLQINFLYLSELRGDRPHRSRVARLHDAEQAVFNFMNWKYVAGKRFKSSDFPKVTPESALQHQIALTETRRQWVLSGKYGDMGPQYYCKSLAWLCYNIHKLSSPPSSFSWSGLETEATDETKNLVKELLILKSARWDPDAIRAKMPALSEASKKLIDKYAN